MNETKHFFNNLSYAYPIIFACDDSICIFFLSTHGVVRFLYCCSKAILLNNECYDRPGYEMHSEAMVMDHNGVNGVEQNNPLESSALKAVLIVPC